MSRHLPPEIAAAIAASLRVPGATVKGVAREYTVAPPTVRRIRDAESIPAASIGWPAGKRRVKVAK